MGSIVKGIFEPFAEVISEDITAHARKVGE